MMDHKDKTEKKHKRNSKSFSFLEPIFLKPGRKSSSTSKNSPVKTNNLSKNSKFDETKTRRHSKTVGFKEIHDNNKNLNKPSIFIDLPEININSSTNNQTNNTNNLQDHSAKFDFNYKERGTFSIPIKVDTTTTYSSNNNSMHNNSFNANSISNLSMNNPNKITAENNLTRKKNSISNSSISTFDKTDALHRSVSAPDLTQEIQDLNDTIEDTNIASVKKDTDYSKNLDTTNLKDNNIETLTPITPTKNIVNIKNVNVLNQITPEKQNCDNPVPFPNDDSNIENEKGLEKEDSNRSNTNSSSTGRERDKSFAQSLLNKKQLSPSNLAKFPPIAAARSSGLKLSPNWIQSSISSAGDDSINKLSPKKKKIKPELKNIKYASDRKNLQFHNTFSNVSEHERLIGEFNCAYNKEILYQGKLYLTETNLYFYSSFIGFVTKEVISINDIVQIEKRSTAGLFKNGIFIETVQNKYNFVSFINRDNTYDLISEVWTQSTIEGRARGLTTNDDDSESSEEEEEDDVDMENESEESSVLSTKEDNGSVETNITSDENNEGSVKIKAKTKKGGNLGPSEHAPTTSTYKPNDNERKINESVINAPLGQVANILFGDDTEPLANILKAQKNYDITSPIPKLSESKTRDYDYVKPLSGSIGPSKTKCIINEKIDNWDYNSFIQVTQTTKNPDVPSGNAFEVKTTYILTWNKDNTTKLTTYCSIVWSGKSWIKGAIEKGTFDGITESTKSTVSEINSILSSSGLSSKKLKKSSTKSSIISLPTLEPTKHSPTKADLSIDKGTTTISKDVTIKAPMGTVYQLLFGDDTSYLKKIVELQNNFNLSEITKFDKGTKQREYNYIKKLNNSMGPKQTKCLITEKIEKFDMNSYILVTQSSKTPDVPSGNSFTVDSKIYLSWGENNTTLLNVLTNINWSGRSFLKGAIEKGSIDGQKESTKIIINQLNHIISTAGTEKVGRKDKGTKEKSVKLEGAEKKEEIENKPSGGILDTIISAITSTFSEIDFTSPKTMISAVFIVFFFILLKTSISGRGSNRYGASNIRILRPGKILIDGSEYNYVPSLRTLYDSYEENLQANSKQGSFNNNIVLSTEATLWDWINDRGDKEVHSINEYLYPDDNVFDNITKQTVEQKKQLVDPHGLQELIEGIELANIQLREMQKRLKELELAAN